MTPHTAQEPWGRRLNTRLRPREGWLSLLLLALAAGCLVGSVLAVRWIPQDEVVAPAAALGLLLGAALAKRPLRAPAAWLFLTLYGLLTTTISVAGLLPPLRLWWGDWWALRDFWLQNGALFLDRLGGWLTAVSRGDRSTETIGFACLLGLAAWFLAAYAGWSAYRQRRPLLGLTLMGLAVALNGYYGAAPLEWAAAFVGVAVILAGVLHFANLEAGWQARQVDYSREIRLELIAYAGAIGLSLLALSLALPALNSARLSRFVLNQPIVRALEETLNSAFAGVAQPRGRLTGPGRPGGEGLLPRDFLLGAGPELTETVVMTATVTLLDPAAPPELLNGRHWRALSYESYTGRGWTLSDERMETFPAGADIPQPELTAQTTVSQRVQWVFDSRVIRYTIGWPQRFDQPTTVAWRGLTDLVRVQSTAGPIYHALARLPAADAAALRRAAVENVAPTILARYTTLPASLPQRVHDLAQEIAGGYTNAYDQARALERFLRQYAYSLDIDKPPDGVDVVDYFLFDAQVGYCDYYASAMVVLARSLGLPARLAVGYLPQPPDADGVQIVRQINAHAWAEIYFAGYGWVEFEPTAPFVTTPTTPPETALGTGAPPTFTGQTAPLPERAPQRPFPWGRLITLLAMGLAVLSTAGALAWEQRRRQARYDEITWRYGLLQAGARKLGQPLPPSQTPAEFNRELQARLEWLSAQPRLAGLTQSMRAPIAQLTELFMERQYSGHPDRADAAAQATAVRLWQRLRRPIWLLRTAKRLQTLAQILKSRSIFRIKQGKAPKIG
jgi:transglutaminase-like putative cysteine protease